MKTLEFTTVKALRDNLKRLLDRVEEGQRLVITRRGQPVAVLVPFESPSNEETPAARPYSMAWPEIVKALEQSLPEFPGWREALDRSRRR